MKALLILAFVLVVAATALAYGHVGVPAGVTAIATATPAPSEPAANNLAWMLAEDGRLDEALRLATVAKERLRQRPEAEDTLGWVYYKKNLPGHAIPAFERAIARAPDNPTYHYHLGLASVARQSLSRCIRTTAHKSRRAGEATKWAPLLPCSVRR